MDKQISDVLNTIAANLGIAVSELYSVMIQQCRVQIVKDIFSVLICLLVLGLCELYVYIFFVRRSGPYEETLLQQSEDDFGILAHVFLAIGVAVLICIAVCFCITYIQEIIQCVLNPKYWAIKEIISMF